MLIQIMLSWSPYYRVIYRERQAQKKFNLYLYEDIAFSLPPSLPASAPSVCVVGTD